MVVKINDPRDLFDFDAEATLAAVNEACAGTDVECNQAKLCPECKVLMIAIRNRLVRAFEAGRRSATS